MNGSFRAAQRDYDVAASICERAGATNTVDYVVILKGIGDCYEELQDFPRALQYLQRALDCASKLNHDDVEVVKAHAHTELLISVLYMHLGRTTEAVAALQSSIVLNERVHYVGGVISALINLTSCFLPTGTGEFEKGVAALARAEALCNTVPNGAVVHARQLATIAALRLRLHEDIGRRDEWLVAALATCAATLLKHKNLYGEQSAEVARVHVEMGGFHAAMGKGARASECFKSAADIFTALSLENSVDYATLLAGWGQALMLEMRIEAGLAHYQQGLAIYRELLPPDHAFIASTLAHIGICQGLLGRGAAAAKAGDAAEVVLRRSQTRCAGPGCDRKMKADGTPLTMCAACERTHYCSVACQTADWKPRHREECKALLMGGSQ